MIDFEGRKIPNELNEIVEPSRTVLLVWDMQNDQAGGAFNKDALIRNAPPLIAAAASAGIKTVYTRQTPYLWKDESPAWIHRFMQTQKVDHPSKLTPRRLHGSFGWQIMEPFKPGENDIVIDKRRPTMFIGNEFETVLSNRESPYHRDDRLHHRRRCRSHGAGRLSSRLLYGRCARLRRHLHRRRPQRRAQAHGTVR